MKTIKTIKEPSGYQVLGYTPEDKAEFQQFIEDTKKKQAEIIKQGKVDWNDPSLRRPMTI